MLIFCNNLHITTERPRLGCIKIVQNILCLWSIKIVKATYMIYDSQNYEIRYKNVFFCRPEFRRARVKSNPFYCYHCFTNIFYSIFFFHTLRSCSMKYLLHVQEYCIQIRLASANLSSVSSK